jgi:hypothetical protein
MLGDTIHCLTPINKVPVVTEATAHNNQKQAKTIILISQQAL